MKACRMSILTGLAGGGLCLLPLVGTAWGSGDGSGRSRELATRPVTVKAPGGGGAAGVLCGECESAIDDGGSENSIGAGGGGDIVWANPFSTIEGDCEAICGIRVAFGPVAAGSEVRLFVYDDPNNDGDPADAMLLDSMTSVTVNEDTDFLNEYVFPAPVTVTGGYFVAAAVTHAAGEFPARIDQTTSSGTSWTDIDPPDPNDPLGGESATIDSFGIPGNWMIRPVGTDPVPLCPADTNNDFAVTVQDLSNVILNWGSDDPDSDVTNNGTVDVQDLSLVILEWGVCDVDNDDCDTARLVADGTYAFTTIGSTLDATAPPYTCGSAVNDVWFDYVASCPLTVVIDTAGSNFDTVLEVYAGLGCPPLTSLDCDDDTLGSQSLVEIDVEEGDELKIRVGGWDGDAEGLGKLNIACVLGSYACNSTPESPPNDCCDPGEGGTGPTKIAGKLGTVSLPFDNTSAETDGPNDLGNPCSSLGDDSDIHKDLWYLYNSPDTGFLNVSTCLLAMFDSKIAAYSVPKGIVDCDLQTLVDNFIECNEDCTEDEMFSTSTLSIPVDAGQSYLIRLGSFSADGTDASAEFGAGTIDFNFELPPENDLCENATALTDGDHVIDTSSAFTDGPAHDACQFDGQTYHDIWFTYTATCKEDSLLQVSTCNQAGYDTDIVIYDGAAACPPGDADVIGCNDDGDDLQGTACGGFTSFLEVAASPGDQFLIRVGGFMAGSQGVGTLSVNCLPRDNDRCDLATVLAPPGNAAGVPSVGTGDTCDANPDDNIVDVDCGLGLPVDPGRWFITTGDGTSYTASLCSGAGTDYDSRLSVFCGLGIVSGGDNVCDAVACAELEPLDNCGGDDGRVTWCTQDGFVYLILVHGEADCGNFTLDISSNAMACADAPCVGSCCIGGECMADFVEEDCAALVGEFFDNPAACTGTTCVVGPDNDNCAAAIEVFDGVTAFDSTNATTDGPDETGGACEFGGSTPNADIWYTYTATCTGNANISLCGSSYDTILAVYDGIACPPTTLIDCNDDFCGSFMPSEVTVPVTQGNQYLIRVGGFALTDTGTGTMTITCP